MVGESVQVMERAGVGEGERGERVDAEGCVLSDREQWGARDGGECRERACNSRLSSSGACHQSREPQAVT